MQSQALPRAFPYPECGAMSDPKFLRPSTSCVTLDKLLNLDVNLNFFIYKKTVINQPTWQGCLKLKWDKMFYKGFISVLRFVKHHVNKYNFSDLLYNLLVDLKINSFSSTSINSGILDKGHQPSAWIFSLIGNSLPYLTRNSLPQSFRTWVALVKSQPPHISSRVNETDKLYSPSNCRRIIM